MSYYIKKTLGIIAVIALVIIIIYFAVIPSEPENMVAHITMDGRTITVHVYSYQRISNGWMKIIADDGNVYQVNEKNVILEGK